MCRMPCLGRPRESRAWTQKVCWPPSWGNASEHEEICNNSMYIRQPGGSAKVHHSILYLGYCPTMYMMLEAMMALLSLPFFCSQSPSRSLMTVTRKRFSSSSCIEPDIDPMAQQSVFKFFQDHSLPFTWKEENKGISFYFNRFSFFVNQHST